MGVIWYNLQLLPYVVLKRRLGQEVNIVLFLVVVSDGIISFSLSRLILQMAALKENDYHLQMPVGWVISPCSQAHSFDP